VVNVFITALPGEIEQEPQGGGAMESKKQPAPGSARLVKQIDEALKSHPNGKRLIQDLNSLVYKGQVTTTPRKQVSIREVLSPQMFKENDVVISSFGKHPFNLKRSTNLRDSQNRVLHPGGSLSQMIVESKKSSWDDDGATVAAPPVTAQDADGTAAPTAEKADFKPYRRWMKP
jgi:hypothetical protein